MLFKKKTKGIGVSVLWKAIYYIVVNIINIYTLWISRCIAAARERIPGSIDNYVTGVSECSQQRSNLKDDGYKHIFTTIPYHRFIPISILTFWHNVAPILHTPSTEFDEKSSTATTLRQPSPQGIKHLPLAHH